MDRSTMAGEMNRHFSVDGWTDRYFSTIDGWMAACNLVGLINK